MNKNIKFVVYCLILFIILFMIYCSCNQEPKPYEGFVSSQCPSMMIKKGDQILLYNPEKVKVPGVNPIVLKSLKDYEKYLKWQRANGMNCPILHLEQVFNTQGDAQYEIRNSFMLNEPINALNQELPNLRGPPCMERLMNTNVENTPFNQNMYPPFPTDPQNQEIGKITENVLSAEPPQSG